MIIGAHSVIYSTDPEADQRFLRDVLRLPAVDGGGGYLILGLPPAEASVHPASKDNLQHELYLLCDNIEAFIAEMRKHSVPPLSRPSHSLPSHHSNNSANPSGCLLSDWPMVPS
jgi:hypothetical protein